MQILRDYHHKHIPDGMVLALGNFDGVHRGHQAVLSEAQRVAEQQEKPWGVLTFWPHPREFFAPQQKPWCLQPLAARLRTLKQYAVPHVSLLRFHANMAAQSAQDFVDEVLVKQWRASHVVTGQNFMFGTKRQGDAEFLRQRLQHHGVGYSAVPAVIEGSQPCSSTRLRFALAEGHVNDISAICSRDWQVQGRVFQGHQRGRLLGFPTANIHLQPHFAWHHGVYAVRARLLGQSQWLPAVASYGVRPQFGAGACWLEVHVLDMPENTNYYHHTMQVELVEFLRPEMTFQHVDALIEQMHTDVVVARQSLQRNLGK